LRLFLVLTRIVLRIVMIVLAHDEFLC
jgi:hypothetical protein